MEDKNYYKIYREFIENEFNKLGDKEFILHYFTLFAEKMDTLRRINLSLNNEILKSNEEIIALNKKFIFDLDELKKQIEEVIK